MIAHDWRGGVSRHLGDLATLLAPRCVVLTLTPAGAGVVRLGVHGEAAAATRGEDAPAARGGDAAGTDVEDEAVVRGDADPAVRSEDAPAAWFALPDDLPALAAFMRELGVARLHFHHVHRLPQAVLDLPSAAALPYDVTLHDHLAICPQFHLNAVDGRYCGEPDEAGCAKCLEARPAAWGLDIRGWRAAMRTLLAGAERRIAPTRDVAARLARHFPELSVEVWPPPEAPVAVPPRPVRVLAVGRITPEKGLDVIAACARDARARGLPLEFRVLGATSRPLPDDAGVTVLGEYDERALPAGLAREAADVLFFPAQVPESWSYTLSAALAAGLPIVASALGALDERLAGRPQATLVPWDAPASAWNDALAAAAGAAFAAARRASSPMPAAATGATDPAAYRARYLAPLPAAGPRKVVGAATRRRARAGAPVAAARRPRRQRRGAPVAAGALYRRRRSAGKARHAPNCTGACPRHRASSSRCSRFAPSSPPGSSPRSASSRPRRPGRDGRATTSTRRGRGSWSSSRRRRGGSPRRCAMRLHRAKVTATRLRAGARSARHLPRQTSVALTILRNDGPAALARRIRGKLARGRGYRPLAATTYAQETAIAPLAFAPPVPPLRPRVSIIVPAYGQPLLTYTCLKSVHANTPPDLFEVIVADDASPEPLAPALAEVTGVRIERNPENLGFLHTCNRAAGLARGEVLVFLNNDTIVTAGLARRAARGLPPAARRGARRRQARLPRRPAAGGRRHRLARRQRVERRPRRRSGPARVQLPARGRLLLRRLPRRPGRAVRVAGRLRCALRPRVLRGHRSRLRGARRGAPGDLPAARDRRPLRRTDLGHRRRRRSQAAPGRQPGHVRAEVGGRARRAPRQRRPAGARARPRRAAPRAGRRRLHADARPGLRLGAHAGDAGADARARLQGELRRRQPRASRAVRVRPAASRRRGAVPPVHRVGHRPARRARRRVRRDRRVAALHRGAARRGDPHVRAAGPVRVRHRRPAFPARGAAGRAHRQHAGQGRGASEARCRAGADPQGRRDAGRQSGGAGAAAATRSRRPRRRAVEHPRALRRRQAFRRAPRHRVHRRLPASAQHRRGAVVREGDTPAACASDCPAS